MKEKIVFFGAGPYVEQIIETLRIEFDLVQIVSSKEKFTDELINQLKSTGAKVAVLASFGQIIPQKVLNLFPLGIINIHPSLLPKFRGPTPVQSAILAGETSTGVSIMKLDSEVDHGPILIQKKLEIDPTDTSESLYKKSFELGAQLIVDNLPKYISGELEPTEQDNSQSTFTEQLTRESGFIDINHEPRATRHQLELMIRAYYPWPGVWFRYQIPPLLVGEGGGEVKKEQSKLEGKLIKLLPVGHIQVEGKNVMTFKDFANGYSEGKKILENLKLLS